MTTVPPSVSVIVPTFRRPETLRTTLAALLALDYPAERYDVIVVDDNGDDPATARAVREAKRASDSVRLLAQPSGGAATARNAGARLAEGELLLFCDDDIVVEPGHLRLHLATRDAHGDALVNGDWTFSEESLVALRATPFGRYRLDLEEGFKAQLDERPLGGSCVEPPLLSACNLALRRELFWELGGFDAGFPYAGAEDQDFSLRARRAGCHLVRNYDIRLLHNDPTVTLRQFCTREERSAQTAVVLARRFPERLAEIPIVTQNRPITRGDRPGLVIKKSAKWLLSRRPVLATLQEGVSFAERVRLGESRLRRLYQGLIGLHIFLGVRRELLRD